MKDLRIYVVSLAKNNPRRAGLAEALAPLGRPYEIVDAVDGRRGLDKAWESEVDREEASRREGYRLTDGELACSLSHRIAWERFLRSDGEWALVLEDDAILDERIGRFLDAGSYRAAPMLLLHHLEALALGRGAIAAGTESRAVRLANTPSRTTAYTINRSIAQCLIEAQSPVRSLADFPIDLHLAGARALVPMIVEHPPFDIVPSELEFERSEAISAAPAPTKAPRQSLSRIFNFAYWKRKRAKHFARKVS